jgi:cell wall-associated NlpC family hydrolase
MPALAFSTLQIGLLRTKIIAMRFLRNFLVAICAVLTTHPYAYSKTREIRTSVRVAKVLVSTAKLRDTPSESSRTLGLMDHNATLTVLSTKSGWVHVKTKRGTDGWIRRDLVSVSKSREVKVTPVTRPVSISKRKELPKAKIAVTQTTKLRPVAHQSAKVVTRQTLVAPSSSSDGQLPETVKTSKNVSDTRIAISDPISDKRNSVVGFAQDFAASNKSASPVRSTLMSRANSLRGTPYRYGTSGGGTFDCSGFTSAMYRKVGVKLPRTAAEQFGVGLHISKSSLSKGDLVFFRNTAGRRGISHVGIYSGNGMFIHASSRGHAVRIDTLNSGYYSGHFAGGRRLIR